MNMRNYMLIGLLPFCITACQTDEVMVRPEGSGNAEQTREEPEEPEKEPDRPINGEILP